MPEVKEQGSGWEWIHAGEMGWNLGEEVFRVKLPSIAVGAAHFRQKEVRSKAN